MSPTCDQVCRARGAHRVRPIHRADRVVAPFDASAAASCGRVRARLEAAGTPIGDLDALIAGHALAIGSVLVTNNTAEFRRVAGLVVEDWTA